MKKFDKSWGFKNRVQRYDFLHNFLIFVHKKLIFAKEKPNSALSNKQNGVIILIKTTNQLLMLIGIKMKKHP